MRKTVRVDNETSLVCMEKTLICAHSSHQSAEGCKVYEWVHLRSGNIQRTTQHKTTWKPPAGRRQHQSCRVALCNICAVRRILGRDQTHAAQDMSYGFLRAHLPKCILKLDALDVLFQFPLRASERGERGKWIALIYVRCRGEFKG